MKKKIKNIQILSGNPCVMMVEYCLYLWNISIITFSKTEIVDCNLSGEEINETALRIMNT